MYRSFSFFFILLFSINIDFVFVFVFLHKIISCPLPLSAFFFLRLFFDILFLDILQFSCLSILIGLWFSFLLFPEQISILFFFEWTLTCKFSASWNLISLSSSLRFASKKKHNLNPNLPTPSFFFFVPKLRTQNQTLNATSLSLSLSLSHKKSKKFFTLKTSY